MSKAHQGRGSLVSRSTEKQKMLAGELYLPSDPELVAERLHAKRLCHRYNRNGPELDRETLSLILGAETNAHLEPPFFCDYGYNLKLGNNVYANHNLIVLDCAPVIIGDDVLIGPNVVLATAGHPTDPDLRVTQKEWAKPITIGNRVWIGASVVVGPGVEIGEGTTIGAGSIVTRSIPPRSVAVGNPCRVIRQL